MSTDMLRRLTNCRLLLLLLLLLSTANLKCLAKNSQQPMREFE